MSVGFGSRNGAFCILGDRRPRSLNHCFTATLVHCSLIKLIAQMNECSIIMYCRPQICSVTTTCNLTLRKQHGSYVPLRLFSKCSCTGFPYSRLRHAAVKHKSFIHVGNDCSHWTLTANDTSFGDDSTFEFAPLSPAGHFESRLPHGRIHS